MRQMSLYKLGLAALAGAVIAGCNLFLVSYEDGYRAAGGSGGSSSTASSSSSGSSGTGLSGGGGTGGTPPVQGRTLWSNAFGDGANDTVNAVAVDPDDHIYLTGRTSSYHDFGCDTPAPAPDAASPGTGYLVELDADGKCVWATYFGTDAEGTALAVTEASVYLAGVFKAPLAINGWEMVPDGEDAFLVSFQRSMRTPQWVTRIGESGTAGDQRITALSASTTRIAASGTFTGSAGIDYDPASMTTAESMATGSDNTDSFVFWLDADGTFKESFRVDSEDTNLPQTASDVAVRPTDQAVVVMGTSRGDTKFNGGEPKPGSAEENVFIAAYESDKTTLFTRLLGDSAVQWGRRVAFDSQGRTVIGGEFSGVFEPGGLGTGGGISNMGGADIFLARYDDDGLPVGLAMQIGLDASSSSAVTLGGMAIFENKYIIAAGGLRGSIQGKGFEPTTSNGGRDAWVARIEFDLSKGTWIRRFGDGKDQSVTAAAVDSQGNTIIVGHFQGAIDFDDTMSPHTNAGSGNDIFIAKLAP